MADEGWIKLYRKIMKSFVWTNSDQLKLWLLVLMKANHSQNKFLFNGEEVSVSQGQFVTGVNTLGFEFNQGVKRDKAIAGRTLWRWLKRFEKEQMLTIKSTTKYSVISVSNWGEYQESVKHLSSVGQSPVNHLSTNKNDKNEENEKKSTIYSPVIDYLNQKAGTKYKSSGKNTQTLIRAREKDGFKLDDFKKVIDNKVAEWKGTDMEQYLRPITLFGTRFESYLNQKPVKPKQRQNFTQNNDQYSNLGW
ncbi:conserved phage C-terminal domain-containing protein [Lapidilactobacillus gannanensis]|uniref:Conserved phage C-terminal domain-containing protein n=1 Tax=Lapidilactobacillus gannanensis TaxID=2486002 RepID=A0ABW4BK32_9LACO|nr:conserved phage C-terminal domain-containing protein [Lapidilactobacillus gannanensis]